MSKVFKPCFGGPSEKLRSCKYPIFPWVFNTFEVPGVLRRSFGGSSEKVEKLQFLHFPKEFQRFQGSGGSSEVLRRFFGKGREASNPSFSQGISTFFRFRRFFGGPSEVLRKGQSCIKLTIWGWDGPDLAGLGLIWWTQPF